MREGEWGNPDRIGKERPTQPKDCGEMTAKQQEALRIRILESGKFASEFQDRICDDLTVGQAGVIGYYLGMSDKDGLYRYMKEVFGGAVEYLIEDMEPNTTMGDDE